MFAEEEINAALVRELCSGRKFIESLEKRREIEASAEARKMREVKSIAGKLLDLFRSASIYYLQTNTGTNVGITASSFVTFSNHNHT